MQDTCIGIIFTVISHITYYTIIIDLIVVCKVIFVLIRFTDLVLKNDY